MIINLNKNDIKYYNYYDDEIINNPSRFSFYEVLDKAIYNKKNRNKLLDNLLLRLDNNYDCDNFKYQLSLYNIYEEYVNYILNCKNDELKIHFLLYMEPMLINLLFNNIDYFSKYISINKDINGKQKINYFLKLSELRCNKITINFIRNQINKIFNDTDYDLLINEQELNIDEYIDLNNFEENPLVKKEYLLNFYNAIIDYNQINNDTKLYFL